jgi:hypothetical protein
MTTINVQTSKGPIAVKTIKTETPGLVVHKGVYTNGYTVTQESSGMAVVQHIARQSLAKLYARALKYTFCQWDKWNPSQIVDMVSSSESAKDLVNSLCKGNAQEWPGNIIVVETSNRLVCTKEDAYSMEAYQRLISQGI